MGTVLLIVAILGIAGFSIGRGEPPLSLLMGLKPHTTRHGWDVYKVDMPFPEFSARTTKEAWSKRWARGARSQTVNGVTEAWEHTEGDGWSFQFQQNPDKSHPDTTIVLVRGVPPEWFRSLKDAIGLGR
jgi:hypothetical protein